jgi:excisionase family DNA binding protein
VSTILEHASEAENPFGIRRSVSISEAAAFLEISKSTMKALIRTGKIRSVKIGGSRRILVDSLLHVAERGTN